MNSGEAHQMRTRTRGRAISRLIENHRPEFDALVAEERQHAEAWQRRIQRPDRRPADLAPVEILMLRRAVIDARIQSTRRGCS